MMKMIHLKLYKMLKFIDVNSMCKAKSVLENKTHKVLYDLKIQMDHTLQPTRPHLIKLTWRKIDLVVSTDHKGKIKENEKIDKHLNFAIELKNLWCIKVTVTPLVIWSLGTFPKNLEKRLG